MQTLISIILCTTLICLYNKAPYHWFCDYDGTVPTGREIKKDKKIEIRPKLKNLSNIILIFMPIEIFILWNNYSEIFKTDYIAEQMVNYIVMEFVLITAFLTLLFIAISDVMYMIIPDQCVAIMFILGTIKAVFSLDIRDSMISALVGASLCLTVYVAPQLLVGRLKKQETLGGGDIKLLCCIGFFCGVKHTVIILLLLSIIVGLAALFALCANFLLKRVIKNKLYTQYVPLGPCAMLSFLLGGL